MPTKHVVNCATGEQSYAEMTDEEVAAQQAMADSAAALDAEQAEAATAKAAAKASGDAKLKELGLTDEEIAAR